MSSVDPLIAKAWAKVTPPYAGAKLRLTALLNLFNELEDLVHHKLLSSEYREFLVEFIMECPDSEIDQTQFKLLMERLFECTIEDVLNGSLIQRSKGGFSTNSNLRNVSNEEQKGYFSEDFTQTMTAESRNFNSFMQKGTKLEQEKILRDRINELELMLSNSQKYDYRDDRTINKMKDVLIVYYRKLDSINKSKVITQTSAYDDERKSELIRRMKNNIDKQDVLITELKRKVKEEIPSGLIPYLKYKTTKFCEFIWKFLRIPIYIILLILIINICIFVFIDETDGDTYEMGSDELYWRDIY